MFFPQIDQIGRSRFDEYVIGAPSGNRPWRWTRLALVVFSILLFVFGAFFSLPILNALGLKWDDYFGAFMLAELGAETADKIPAGYYAWGLIYNSWALPFGLLTLSMLLFSACLITNQIEQDQSNVRLAHMPAVFVRPRLKWRSIGVDTNGLTADKPILSIDLLNLGEALAIRVQLSVVDLYLNTSPSIFFRRSSATGLTMNHDHRDAYYARLVPAGHDSKGDGDGSVTENFVRTHSFSIPESPGNALSFGSLLQNFLSPGESDFPALVLVLKVKFETIRGVKFNETIVMRWSGHTCRAAANPSLRGQISELGRVVEANSRTGWRAHQPLHIDGRPEDLSSWTWLTLSPRVANVRAGKTLKWGGTEPRRSQSGEVQ